MVIHITACLCRQAPRLSWFPGCTALPISISTGQTQPGHCKGGSHRQLPLSTTIMPPAWPCLYLTVQQQVLMWTACLGRGSDEQSCFLVRKSSNSLNDQSGVTLSTDRVCMLCCTLIGGQFDAGHLGFSASKGMLGYLYHSLFLYTIRPNK